MHERGLSGSHNNTRDTRTKTVVLEVYDHATISSTWYIFCSTAIILTIIIIVATTLISAMIKRTLSPSSVSSEDERPMLGESAMRPSYQVEVMEGMYSAGGLQHRQNGRPLSQENSHFCNEQEADGIERGGNEDGIGHVGRRGILALDTSGGIEGGNSHNTQAVVPVHSPSFLPATTHAPVGESMDINDSFNPRIVLWWKCVAVHEAGTAEAQVSEVGFQNSLIIMGVFAALPTSELLRSYLSMVLHHGKEDQCFWNSRCLTAFGFLPDFARVFTNYGYILLGVAFVIIVKKHKNLTSNILKQFRAKNSVGVTHCYGLFVSLGYGLIMQGVMSALYHTCPNSVTIKFDMMFMYVMMVVAVVTIWGLRHGDVTHHVYPTVITVGLALLVAEARMWLRREWFWGLLSTVYVILLLSNAVLMSTYGIWSFSLSKLWHVWSAWKPVAEKLKNVMGEQDTSSQPMQVARVLVGVGSNIGLIVYGNLGDPDVYNFILIVCLVNMGLYFANYVMMKKLSFEEKGTVLAWVCLAFSILLWIIALVFFFQRRSDSERSPADSRNKNSPCDFLHVFDEHDIWHITSSFALFFFFVALLTMDDDLCWKSSQEIKARNAEKAMTTLARWRAAQEGGAQQQKSRRPYLASECEDLREAEKWRNQVISEVARKVSQIQNAGLGEFRIRDLNDEINKLLREKGHWEVRIKELGGPDYGRVGPKMTDMDGQEAPGNRGYMYFGAAKDLPGVRELFEQEPPPPPRKTRGELMKDIDADYYGYRDDDDGVLIPLERLEEKKAIKAAIREYKNKKLAAMSKNEDQEETADPIRIEEEDEDEESEGEQISPDETDERSEVARFMAHVPNIPSQADIEAALVERKKRELLETFLGD